MSRIGDAISALAARIDDGELLAATDPAGLLLAAVSEIDRLRGIARAAEEAFAIFDADTCEHDDIEAAVGILRTAITSTGETDGE